MNILFLLIEYSGIPFALLLYSFCIKQLASPDPVKSQHETTNMGLELMVINSVSTLLYGISFLGHENFSDLHKGTLICVIVSFSIYIVELFIVIVMVWKIRQMGSGKGRGVIIPYLIALSFWFVLVILIISCCLNNHSSLPITGARASEDSQVPSGLIAFIVACSIVMLLLIVIGIQIIRRYKEIAIKNYNKGAQSAPVNPRKAIEALQKSLQNLPSDSALRIDIQMKLSGIYDALGQYNDALSQIVNIKQSLLFANTSQYLRDAILAAEIRLLVKLKRVPEAKELIGKIGSDATSSQLKLLTFDLK